ncbi:MAG TPA: UDP-3-O-acyl-N-acetylglucosamine deacetylase [Rhizomicrobium sp.]|nr:UDP-3-O-acyl-N-acetylglucosamine deacetylase [Rhizomicrobium sp.]
MARRTIAREVSGEGVALHAGTHVRARLLPADPGRGVAFRRDDLGGMEVPARYDRVTETRLGTVISENGARIGVIEHLMAAVSGAGIDDLVVALDGPEPPILDGDALSWLAIIETAGIREQPGERRAVRIAKRVEVEDGDASAALSPADARTFDFSIAFDSVVIGTQHYSWTFSREAFRRDIAPARTFGFVHELDALLAAGLAKGASLDNTLAIEGGRLRNPALQRFGDEFVRHKILDAIGDLALAGSPVIGHFEGRRSGHALNNRLLRALFSDPANYECVVSGANL